MTDGVMEKREVGVLGNRSSEFPTPSSSESVSITTGVERVTVIELEVVVFPAPSVATAVMVYEPSGREEAFHVTEYGTIVSGEPRFWPLILNWTEATPEVVWL